jgi:transketolase
MSIAWAKVIRLRWAIISMSTKDVSSLLVGGLRRIDGHDMEEIVEVLAAVGLGQSTARNPGEDSQRRRYFFHSGQGRVARPSAFEEEAERAIAELRPSAKIRNRSSDPVTHSVCRLRKMTRRPVILPSITSSVIRLPTREAFGNALLRIGEVDPRVVALDGDT